MSIIRAMDDPELFARHFRGESWGPWRAFLKALFALPMGEADLATYSMHTGRTAPPAQPFKEAALICGRRAGKSRIMALVGVYTAAFHDFGPHLAPGEIATVAILASDRKQARTIFRYARGLLRAVPMLAEKIAEETGERIALDNDVEIEVTTASFRSSRGYTYACVICDEVAYWRSDEAANPDEEIVRALRPGLSTIPGAMLLLASSPYAQKGVLYNSYKRRYGKDDGRVLCWKASTRAMNPLIDQRIIDEAREDDPAAAAAEFDAEFRSDIAAFVSREVVDACTVPGRYELPRISANRYSAFVDPSGGSSDSMTLAIAHAERDGTGPNAPSRAVLDAVREVKPPFSPEGVVDEFCGLLKAYGVSRVTGDRYGGEWCREPFKKHGIAYDLSERPKSDIYRDVLPLLNSQRAELLDLTTLAKQLCGLERRTARGGRDSIDHAPNGHDDVANAVAGALLAVGNPVMSPFERFKALASDDLAPLRRANVFYPDGAPRR